jgi:hypothetical protein
MHHGEVPWQEHLAVRIVLELATLSILVYQLPPALPPAPNQISEMY